MNLHPSNTNMAAHLPMHHASAKFKAGNEHYSLTEVATGQLIIRIPEKSLKNAAKAIKSITKLALPSTLESTSNNNYSMYWIAPDEFLLVTPEKAEAETESNLRKKMEGHFAIVDVTGGQTKLQLSGERAESIIKKSSAYDVHISNLPISKAVTTNFAKTQAIICRTSEDSFDLIIRRSFSDYIWQWMVDAGSRA